MSLRKFIKAKASVIIATIIMVCCSVQSFAQDAAAAAATTPKVDMSEVYISVIYYILIFLSVCLFIAIIGKSIKVYELSRAAQGKSAYGINWNGINSTLFGLALVLGLYGLYWEYTVHGAQILPDASSIHGKRIDFMFKLTMIITTIVLIFTHILLFGFSFIYRYSGKRRAYYYPHNNTIEKIWTIVPAIVLTGMVLLGFLTWRSIFNTVDDPKNPAIQIEVTSEQYKWNIRYAGADGIVGKKNFKLTTASNALGIDFTDLKSRDDQLADEMVIPVNKPVKLLLNSKDVIHSFYMPQFRVQLNTVPGMTTMFEFTPTETTAEMQKKLNDPKFKYLFYCNKVCGSGHYNMQKVVRVVSEAEYAEWLAKQPTYLNDGLRKDFNLPIPVSAAGAVSDTTVKDSTKATVTSMAMIKK